jgi:tetratricopeptide (TPR) repeat protein
MIGKRFALLFLIFVLSIVYSFAQEPRPGGPDTAIEALKRMSLKGGNRDSLFHSIGSIYLQQEKDSLAIVYLNKVSYNNQKKFNELAVAYSRIDEPDTSLYYLRRAIQINDSLNGRTKNLQYATTCKLLGDYFIAAKNYDSALVEYHQSLIQLVNGFDDEDVRMNPLSFQSEFPAIDLFTVLLSKAKTFTLRYQFDHNKNDLLYSIFAYDALYNFFDGMLLSNKGEEVNHVLAAMRTIPHSEPVDNSLKLFELTGDDVYVRHAFRFHEKSKAVLHMSVSADSVPQAGIPTIEARDVMKKIPRDNAVLSYHVGDTSLVAFILTNKSVGHQVTKYDSTVNQKVSRLCMLVQAKEQRAAKEIDSLSAYLFDVLVRPVEKYIAGVSHLVIVPDEEIDDMPFEILKDDKRVLMLRDYNITYSHSVSSVKFNEQHRFNPNAVIIPLAAAAIGFIIYFSRRRPVRSPSQASGLS